MIATMDVPARLRAYYEAGSPTRELADRLVQAGHECFLVGGTVRDAFLGVRRFDDFQARLGISRNTLNQRLNQRRRARSLKYTAASGNRSLIVFIWLQVANNGS